MSNKSNQFPQDTIDKYSNYMITSQRYHTPPFEWSGGIFQRFKPISGDFPIGNNFFGNMECVNNQSGRGFYANPCGYWDNSNEQFNPGTTVFTRILYAPNSLAIVRVSPWTADLAVA